MKQNLIAKILFAPIVILLAFFAWKAWHWENALPTKIVNFNVVIRDVAIGADGSLLVCGETSDVMVSGRRYAEPSRGENQVALISPAGDVQRIRPEVGNGQMQNVSLSPDGKRVLGSSPWGGWVGEIASGEIASQSTSAPPSPSGLQSWELRNTGRYFWKSDNSIACLSGFDYDDALTGWPSKNQNNEIFLNQKLLSPPGRTSDEQKKLMAVGAAISPNGALATIAWNGVRRTPKLREILQTGFIELWDLNRAKKLCNLEAIKPQGLGQMVFSPDSKLIAAADSAGRGTVWETKNGTLVQMVSGLRHRTNSYNGISMGFATGSLFSETASLAFSPDSRTLFAALNDGVILSYDLQTGLPREVVARLSESTRLVGCSPDGKLLYAVVRGNLGNTLFALKTPPQTAATP